VVLLNRRSNVYVLLGAIIIIVLSRILTIEGSGVVLPLFGGYNLPGACTFKAIFGIDCPTCGMTRSFISISRFSFKEAYKYNPIGFLAYILILFQIPYRIFLIVSKVDVKKIKWLEISLLAYVCIFFVALAINWIVRTLIPIF
jgi:hypothetical protein